MTEPGLDVTDLTVTYSGVLAVDNVSFSAPLGRVTALIGPNGAGKTTTFNACSGLLRPTAGAVYLFGEDVTHAPPHLRARRGLGRSFQQAEICGSLTVAENVALSREAQLAGSQPLRHVLRRRHDVADVAAAVSDALERCGIAHLGNVSAASLSTGQQRLLELARTVAGGYRMLLLDEPSSGLDSGETAQFGEIVAGLTATGIGVLLVEHDMSLVMAISSYLYVLDFGELIFEGTPAAVSASSIVRAAYLGSETRELVALETAKEEREAVAGEAR